MTCVLKIGGAALESADTLQRCVQAIQSLAKVQPQLLVVHGGGTALTRTLKKMGKDSTFINGLRVTDAETRDTAMMVLCGLMNKTLVTALNRAGMRAIGMSGGDGGTVLAKKADLTPDLGFVGDIKTVDSTWFQAIWSAGGIPVMATMAPDLTGQYYNINADQMATACAVACNAKQLIFLTEVSGVLDTSGERIPQLTSKSIASLIEQSVITGGMLPKMAACQSALNSGVERVRIFPAGQAHLLTSSTLQTPCGTEVTL
jgi:acetylglutamate kinase